MSDSVRPHRRQPNRLPIRGILQARTLEWVAISFSNNKSKLRHAKNPAIYLNKVFILFGINKCSAVYVLECLLWTPICYFKSLSSFPVISPCFKSIREGLSSKVLTTTFLQSIHSYLTNFLFIYNIINIHYRKLKKILFTHLLPCRNKILVNAYKSFSVHTDIYT